MGIIAIASTLMAVAITDRVVKGAGEVSRSRANVEHAHACLSGFGLGRLPCLAIAFLFLAFSCLDLSFLCLDLGSPSFCLFTASLIDMHSVAAKCTA